MSESMSEALLDTNESIYQFGDLPAPVKKTLESIGYEEQNHGVLVYSNRMYYVICEHEGEISRDMLAGLVKNAAFVGVRGEQHGKGIKILFKK